MHIRRRSPSPAQTAFLAAALSAACASADGGPRPAGPPAQTAGAGRPTEVFRRHHVEILEHLGHIDAMAGALARQTPAEQRQTMDRVVTFLREHIGPHAADEERVLYPVVARQAGAGSRLTEVPIREHRIVERWIAALEQEAAQPEPDVAAFTRQAFHLMGLLRAHFEVEEQVLLPVLDASMSAAEFQRDVADRMPH